MGNFLISGAATAIAGASWFANPTHFSAAVFGFCLACTIAVALMRIIR